MTEQAAFSDAASCWRAKLARSGRAIAARLWLYCRRRRERLQLLALSERERRDIGITRVDAIREADKPFWR